MARLPFSRFIIGKSFPVFLDFPWKLIKSEISSFQLFSFTFNKFFLSVMFKFNHYCTWILLFESFARDNELNEM